MDRRQRVRGEGQRRRHARRHHRDLLGDAGRWARASRPAMRSSRSTCSACRSSKIRIVQGDTDRGNGFGSAGSRSLFIGGSAVRVASERTVEHAKTLAAQALEAAAGDIEYRAGRFNVVGTDLGIDLFALAGRQAERRIHLDSTSTVGGADLAERLPRLRGRGRSRHRRRARRRLLVGERHRPRRQPDDRARPGRRRRRAGHRPGAVRARSSTTPRAASSSPAASWTTRCRAPRSAPTFRTEFDTSIPCALNPLGVKGVGELGTIGATPAVMNAVDRRARPRRPRPRRPSSFQMPATPGARLARAERKEMKRRLLLQASATIALPMTARADAFPDHPLRYIVPVPAGGGSDMIGARRHRALGQAARPALRRRQPGRRRRRDRACQATIRSRPTATR